MWAFECGLSKFCVSKSAFQSLRFKVGFSTWALQSERFNVGATNLGFRRGHFKMDASTCAQSGRFRVGV